MEFAHCGIFDCNTCNHLVKGRCPGCEAGNLIVKSDGREPCAIFMCAQTKGIASCTSCTSTVCPFPHNLEMACPVREQFEKPRNFSRKLADFYGSRQTVEPAVPGERKISDRTVTRLRWYLVALNGFLEQDINRVSSQDIGRKVGVKPGLIRRDLSHFGAFGRPSIGYDTVFLRDHLEQILHLDNSKTIVWVGPQRLAEDSSLIERFAQQNCFVTAVFSTDEASAGQIVAGMKVNPISALSEKVRSLGAQGAVVDVPAEEAQLVANTLVMAGVKAILNLTSAILVAPSGIIVRNVDVVAELSALSYYCGGRSRES